MEETERGRKKGTMRGKRKEREGRKGEGAYKREKGESMSKIVNET
jgi:hypothetical protein